MGADVWYGLAGGSGGRVIFRYDDAGLGITCPRTLEILKRSVRHCPALAEHREKKSFNITWLGACRPRRRQSTSKFMDRSQNLSNCTTAVEDRSEATSN